MIEITNAIFCLKATKNPKPILEMPVLSIKTSNLSSIKNFKLPLWVSFLGGEFNHKYSFKIEVSSDICGTIASTICPFTWDIDEPVIGVVVEIRFTPVFFGIHTFTISINDSIKTVQILVEKV